MSYVDESQNEVMSVGEWNIPKEWQGIRSVCCSLQCEHTLLPPVPVTGTAVIGARLFKPFHGVFSCEF
jgi:hypothetical protein